MIRLIKVGFWSLVARMLIAHTEREVAIERAKHHHPAGKQLPNRTDEP